MRARNLKPGFFINEDLAEIEGPWGRLLFAGLWCMADKEGRLEDRPKRIKAQIFPYDEKMPSLEKLLTQLNILNFIKRYRVDSQKYIQINNFKKHQNPHHTERESTLPAPDLNSELTVDSPLSNGGNLADSLIPDSLIQVKETTPTPSGSLVCVYCGVRQVDVDWAFDKDHFIPVSAGGTDDPNNLVDCCHVCNQIKQKRIFATIQDAAAHIHLTLWQKNRARYEVPRKIMFGGKPPEGYLGRGPQYSEEFENFWNAYPKQVGKGEAWSRWQKLKKAGILPENGKIQAAITEQSKSDQWRKDGGQFIPNPATWLNQARWDDKLQAAEEARAW